MLTTVPHWLTRSCVFILDKLIDPTEALNFQLKVASSYVAEAETRVQKAEALYRPNISKWYDEALSALGPHNIKSIYGLAHSTAMNANMCEFNLDDAVWHVDKAKDMLSSAFASGRLTIEIALKVEQYAIEALEYLEKASKEVDLATDNSLNLLILITSSVEGELQQEEYDKNEEDGVACSICLDNFRRGAVSTCMPCSYVFHDGCLREWLTRKTNFPICRTKLCVPPSSR